MPSNVLPLQTFLPIIRIFTVNEDDIIESRLPFKIFSALPNTYQYFEFQVSYVLIVQQPEDKDKGGSEEAIGVYDFENENDFDDDNDGIDDKSKIRKIKTSQQVKNR